MGGPLFLLRSPTYCPLVPADRGQGGHARTGSEGPSPSKVTESFRGTARMEAELR